MNYLAAAIGYILDPGHWSGYLGIGHLMAQHVLYSLLGVGLSAIIGMPLGWWVGHTGRGRGLLVSASGAVRALPTLGLITLFGLALGIGLLRCSPSSSWLCPASWPAPTRASSPPTRSPSTPPARPA